MTISNNMPLRTTRFSSATHPDDIKAVLPRYPVPAFRIAELAVDKKFQGTGVGSWLLRNALQRALDISVSVAIFAVLIDAIDDKAKGFISSMVYPLAGSRINAILASGNHP